MKYYYGNSYKEAISNEPVEIKTTKQLRSYEENYSFVVAAIDVGVFYKEEEEEEEEESNFSKI